MNKMTEQQKARIVELADKCWFALARITRNDAADQMYGQIEGAKVRAANASAEAFRIAQAAV